MRWPRGQLQEGIPTVTPTDLRAKRLAEQDARIAADLQVTAKIWLTQEEKLDKLRSRVRATFKRMSFTEFKNGLKKRGYAGTPTYIGRMYLEYARNPTLTIMMNAWFEGGGHGNASLRESFTFAHDEQFKDNLILFTYGEKRSGKSFFNRHMVRQDCRIMHANIHWHMYSDDPSALIDEVLDPAWKSWIDAYEIMGFEDAPRIVPRMRAHDWLIVDELPDMVMEGAMGLWKAVKNLLKIASGKRQLNFCILNQQYKPIPNVQLIIEIIATNRSAFRTLAAVKVMNDLGQGQPDIQYIIDWDVRGEPAAVSALYEQKNDEMKEKSQENAGVARMGICAGDVKRVIDAVHNMTDDEIALVGKEFRTEGALASFFDLRPDLADLANNPRKKSIAGLALNRLRNEKKHDLGDLDPPDPDAVPVIVDMDAAGSGLEGSRLEGLGEVLAKERVWLPDYVQFSERDVEIYKGIKAGTLKATEAADQFDIDVSRIGQICKKLQNVIADQWEIDVVPMLRARWQVDPAWELLEAKRISGAGNPDDRVTLKHRENGQKRVIFYNAKSRYPRKVDASIYIPLGAWDHDDNELRAEIKAARDLHAIEPETLIEVKIIANRHDTGEIFDEIDVDWQAQSLEPVKIALRAVKKHGKRKKS